MASAPRFKVYDSAGVYEGCVKSLEVAAVLVGLLGPGSTVRDGHRVRDIIWTEDVDGDASGSCDAATATMVERINERSRAIAEKHRKMMEGS